MRLVIVGIVLTVVTTLGALVFVDGCNNPNVAPAISNSAACAVDIIEDVTVAIDVAATARDCGLAAQDIYALVTSLLNNMPDAAGTTVTTSKGSVSRADYVSHLQQWQAAAQAAMK